MDYVEDSQSQVEDFQLDGFVDVEDFGVQNTSADQMFTVDLSILPLQEEKGFEYPAVLLSGVMFPDVLNILKTISRGDSFRAVPLWIETPNGSGYSNVGSIQLDSTFLLTTRYLGLGVTLYASDDDIVAIDCGDPATVAKYV